MKQIHSYMKFLVAALVLLMASCSNDNVTQNEDNARGGNQPSGIATFTGGTTDESSTSSALSRTTIKHTQGSGAIALWSDNDKIWVKDNSGTFRQSAPGTLNTTKTRGVFTLSAGTYSNGCQVNYVGNSISGTKVTIATTQSQTAPNNFDHAGASGDCGTAMASGNGTAFNFALNHKASYLCFLPRCMNTELGPNIILQQIIVGASDNIAGEYDFTNGSLVGKTPTNASNKITLNLNNFPLNTTVSDVSKNGAYIVIAPGTRNLAIYYKIKDPTTGTEGHVIKYMNAFTCEEGKIHEITAWIDKDITRYPNQMYMWDAPANQPYWNGVPNYPVVNVPTFTSPTQNYAYPQNNLDPRWYNEYPTFTTPTNHYGAPYRSAANMPSSNEYMWYAQRGDPHWDGEKLWTMDKHLYKGGMWIKKKAYIYGFTSAYTPTGADLNNNLLQYDTETKINIGATPTQGAPANNIIDQYFFLPASGFYQDGKLLVRNYSGYYTSKTATALPYTAMFWFHPTYIGIGINLRSMGISIMPMQ